MTDVLYSALRVLTRRKVTSAPGDGGQTLQQSLSVVDVTCLGLSTTFGTGIFTILSFAAKENAGPSVVLSFLIAAVASCLGGLCYSELASRFPVGGPAYAYVYATLGELPAFLVGWAMVFEYLLGSALAAKALTQYLDVISNHTIASAFKLESSIFSRVPGFEPGIDLSSGLFIVATGLILLKNLKLSCLVNNVLVFVCFLVVGGIVLVSLCDMDADNWTTGTGFFPNGVAGIFAGASNCFFAFHGYDVIATTAGECSHRIRIVPVGISLAFLLGLVACFSSSVSITLLVPTSLLDRTGPLLQAFEIRNIRGMQYFVIIGAVTGLTASLLVSLMALSRLLFFIANDGLLLPFLSSYRTQRGTTPLATIVACLLATVIAMFVQSSTLLMWAGMGSLIAYMFVALSILCLRYGQSERLPFEVSELFSRDSSSSDFGGNGRQTSRSVSDCYLNKSTGYGGGGCKRCDNFIGSSASKASQKQSRRESDHDDDTGSSNCVNFSSSNKLTAHIGRSQELRNYGAVEPRTLAVEYVNHSYVTSLSSSPLKSSKKLPTGASARTVAGLLSAMIAAMLSMALFTAYVPRLFPRGNEWWLELIATILFGCISVLVVLVVRQPRHRGNTRNSIPCVPLLPICAIWMNVHLVVCLAYSAWLAFLIWSLIGIFVYMSYGVWQSKEGDTLDESGCEEYLGLDEALEDERQEIVQQLQEEGHESDDGSSV